jgi:hypothetical protein
MTFSGNPSRKGSTKIKRVLLYGLEHPSESLVEQPGITLGSHLKIGTQNTGIIEFEEPILAEEGVSVNIYCQELACSLEQSKPGEAKADL